MYVGKKLSLIEFLWPYIQLIIYLNVFSPFCLAVVFGDFRLEQVIAGHGSGQTSQWLTTTTTHSHQQGIASWDT